MCSHCGWDEEPADDSDALIADGAEAARNLRRLLDYQEPPTEDDDIEMEDVA